MGCDHDISVQSDVIQKIPSEKKIMDSTELPNYDETKDSYSDEEYAEPTKSAIATLPKLKKEDVPSKPVPQKEISKVEKPSMRKWWIIGGVLVLLLLGLAIYWASRKDTPGNWSKTRDILPLNSVVTLRSKNSGKLLCFQDSKSALPNPGQESKAGLVLEATGASTSDKACQWTVADLIPSQPAELQGIAVRLRNVQYDTYIREIETTLTQNKTPYTDYTYQAGTGARLFSPLLATKQAEGTLICGAVLFKASKTKDLKADNPFLLQSDGEGRLLAGPTVPVGDAPFWDVEIV